MATPILTPKGATKQQPKGSKSKPSKTSGNFKTKNYVLTASAAHYLLEEILGGYNNDTKQHVLHILKCMGWSEDGFVPQPFKQFIEKCFPKSEYNLLVAEGILERREHIYVGAAGEGRCAEFRVDAYIVGEVQSRMWRDWADATVVAPERIDAVRGCAVKAAVLKSTTMDEADNQVSKIVADHIRAYQPCLFNKRRALDYLQVQKQRAEEAKELHGENSWQYEKLKRRYRHNNAAIWSVLNGCAPTHYSGDLWLYKAPYKPQWAGRITHVAGGFQNASRGMQKALFEGIEGYHNMDLRSSQLQLLAHHFDQAGISCEWLGWYIKEPRSKHITAEKLDIPVSVWKQCLMALVMGGFMAKFASEDALMAEMVEPGAAIPAYLLKEAQERLNLEDIRAAELAADHYKALLEETHQLRESLQLWHKYLKQQHCPKQGTYHVKNACGMTIKVKRDAKGKLEVDGRKSNAEGLLAAFILQGHEAAVVAYLAALGSKYDYYMVQNYHDGFICCGNISDEAVREAAQLCGAPYIALEAKPFSDE